MGLKCFGRGRVKCCTLVFKKVQITECGGTSVQQYDVITINNYNGRKCISLNVMELITITRNLLYLTRDF